MSTVSGQELDFEDIVRRYRRELQVYCYRMLGSLEEAEDHVQEVSRGLSHHNVPTTLWPRPVVVARA
jgi:Sigma-70 region 2